MEGPIFVYYQLDNFYQNHRRYVKSRDYRQLMGETRTIDQVKTPCDPIYKNSQLKNAGHTKAVSGIPLVGEEVAIPCGLIAKSLFNDTYRLYDSADELVQFNKTGIAWESDIKYKFKNQLEVPKDEPALGKW